MSFVTSHGDAFIAAGAVLVGVLARVPVDLLQRHSQRADQHAAWLRERELVAVSDVLTGARAVRAAFEQALEQRRVADRPDKDHRYDPVDAVESAFTDFTIKADIARVLPGVPPIEPLYQSARDLVLITRTWSYDERRQCRERFDDALHALISAYQSTLRD
jgi:hypothetical protein